jgi:hypothetical protein
MARNAVVPEAPFAGGTPRAKNSRSFVRGTLGFVDRVSISLFAVFGDKGWPCRVGHRGGRDALRRRFCDPIQEFRACSMGKTTYWNG